MLLSASPLFGSLGLLGAALVVCIALLFVIRAQRSEVSERVDDLTFRMRHPVQHALAHPFQAMRRKGERFRRAEAQSSLPYYVRLKADRRGNKA